jgi:hypothetical protein
LRKDVRVTLLMLVGAGVMFFSLRDVFDHTTTSVIGWNEVSFQDHPNEFLLTVGARITFGLYCFYLAVRVHFAR